MKEKPVSLYFLTFLFLGIGISIPLQIIAMYEYNLSDINLVLANISFPNALVITLSLLTSILCITTSRYALAGIVIQSFAVIWNNYYVGLNGLDFTLTMTSVASLGFITLVSTTLSLGGYRALSNEKWQWWKTTPRKKAEIPVVLRPLKGNALRATTFDLSSTGAFIPCELEGWGELKPGDFIHVHMTFGELKVFRCEAEIVRKNGIAGNYPEGIGIRFNDIDKHHQKILQSEFKNMMS